MTTLLTVKQQILTFRIPELQEAATRLGLSKTGKKAAIQARLLAYLGEGDPVLGRRPVEPPPQQWRAEKAARVVRDIYCRMKGIPNTSSDQSTADQLLLRNGSGGMQHLAGAQNAAQPAGAMSAAIGAAAPAHARAPLAVQPPVAGGNPPAATAGGVYAGAAQHGVAGLGRPAGVAGAPRGRLSTQIRCICHMQTERGEMIQCEDPACGVWQHCDCLGFTPGNVPSRFFCETCRAKLADPFWEPIEAEVLPPSRLKPSGRPTFPTAQGLQEVQTAERVFFLSPTQMDTLQRDPNNHRLQVGCVEIGDEVTFRHHWPKNVDMRVNSMQYRPYTRAVSAKMGINQRDEPASIGALVVRGRNTLTVSAADSGIWVLLLQLTRKRSINQVKAHMAPPETLVQAVGRVRRLVSGGSEAGDDDDDGILVSHQVVSLKDPMSNQRMEVPARFKDASGLQCFDLDTFLSMVERNRKWQDPTTLRNSTLLQLQIDTYMLRVLQCLRASPHVFDIELSADGHWRPAGQEGPWFNITEDPGAVSTQIGAPVAVKPDPEGGGRQEGEVLSSDEEDEHEELRQAARAVAAMGSQQQQLAGQKRKEPEVIDLLDSSDDEQPPPPRRQQQQQQAVPAPPVPQQQPPQLQQRPAAAAMAAAAAAGGTPQGAPPSVPHPHPLRIRLPIRVPKLGAVAAAVPAPQQVQQQQAAAAQAAPSAAPNPNQIAQLQRQQLAFAAQRQQQEAFAAQQGAATRILQQVQPGVVQQAGQQGMSVTYGAGALRGVPMYPALQQPAYAVQPQQPPLIQAQPMYMQQPAAAPIYNPGFANGGYPGGYSTAQPAAAAGSAPAAFIPASQLMAQQQQPAQFAAVPPAAPPSQQQQQAPGDGAAALVRPLQAPPLAAAPRPASPVASEDALNAFMEILDRGGTYGSFSSELFNE